MPKFEYTLDKLVPLLHKLAETLDSKAAVADALANDHAKHPGEAMEAMKQQRRAVSGTEFAKVCREAAGRLRGKIKTESRSFEAPTLLEVLEYAASKHPEWPREDVERWYRHFESCGWVIGKNKPMKDWKSAASNGCSNWREKNPGRHIAADRAKFTDRNGDPNGWSEFLKRIGRRYEEHKYSLPFLQAEFRKQGVIQ